MNLKQFFKENPRIALGFSGGVDSSYLLYTAIQYGAEIQPYYIRTQFQPQFEYEDAMRLAKELNINVKTIEHDILSNNDVAFNPQNRCYYCKKTLFSLLKKQAQNDGYHLIIDGTNASDDANDRPGMTALNELSVRSPLRECSLTKDNIRMLSKEARLFTWNKNAYACLATRIPSGTKITNALLNCVEQSENVLFTLGFSDFRVRVYNGAASLQFQSQQIQNAVHKREEILEGIRPYFETIFLDMEAR